jgi:hypothetical protein
MKSLMSSLALVVSMGLCSAALADGGCNGCGQSDNQCCGHGLLSRLRLHRCNDCCEAPAPASVPCDPCSGHKLVGFIKRIHLPRFGHGDCGSCETPCAPKACEPMCCRTRIARPRLHSCRTPRCAKPACEESCDPCNGGGHLSRLRGLLHRNSCCEAPKSACDSCNSCGGGLRLHGLFGKRCNTCETSCNGCSSTNGVPSSAPAPAPAPAPVPAPAPKPSASSNGLLILTPAG